MSKVTEFYEALSKDEAMQERAKGLAAAGETTAEVVLEAVVAFAKGEGYSFTAEELVDYGKELVGYGKDLSDEKLAAVAGGALYGGTGEVGCPIIGFTMSPDKGGENIDLCLCILYGKAGGTHCFLYGK
jgi:predicted ribosomally synthesized peptide with nif11-like leader